MDMATVETVLVFLVGLNLHSATYNLHIQPTCVAFPGSPRILTT